MALRETTEEDHFGRPSFRVRGRIFATLPDPDHLNVMVDIMDVDGVITDNPDQCPRESNDAVMRER